jgi:hypothetical protein
VGFRVGLNGVELRFSSVRVGWLVGRLFCLFGACNILQRVSQKQF